jgi:hypothetical protein
MVVFLEDEDRPWRNPLSRNGAWLDLPVRPVVREFSLANFDARVPEYHAKTLRRSWRTVTICSHTRKEIGWPFFQ